MGVSISFKIKGGFNTNKLLSVYKNNTRKYTNTDDRENIFSENIKYNVLLEGEENIYQAVRDLYKKEFKSSVDEYNSRQKRADRKIYDYFEKISSDSKTNLYTEVIIQVGDKDFWCDKCIEEKLKMVGVFREQIKIIKEFFPNFKIANAISHFDMISPKTHIVGVCSSNEELSLKNFPEKKRKKKNGLKNYVSQREVFTQANLKDFHNFFDKKSIEIFNKIYKTNEVLNDKKIKQKYLELEEYKRIAPRIKKLQKEYDLLKLQKLELLKEIEILKKEKNKYTKE